MVEQLEKIHIANTVGDFQVMIEMKKQSQMTTQFLKQGISMQAKMIMDQTKALQELQTKGLQEQSKVMMERLKHESKS